MSELEIFENDEMSIFDLIDKLNEFKTYIFRKKIKVFLFSLIGCIIGVFYAWVQPITYTAKYIFVVEEPKSGVGLNGLASLAGQFGLDLGNTSGGGLINGENVLLYFKSESLIRGVLLSEWANGKSFVDQYLELNRNKGFWKSKEKFDKLIPPFKVGINYSRTQDSIVLNITREIIENQINISKIEKRAGYIELTTEMIDERFSKRFCDKLVEVAVNRYIEIKTERQKQSVARLQERADSILGLLNSRTESSVKLTTASATMDINPFYKTSNLVNSELVIRDKTLLSSIYIEVVKNLELAKFTLSQETPVIQMVDMPLYPLIKNKQSRLLTGIIGGIVFFIVILSYYILKIWRIRPSQIVNPEK